MALGLHPDCKKRLLKLISEELRRAIVNNIWIEPRSLFGLIECDNIFPDRIRRKITDFVADNGAVYEFVMNMLNRDLSERREPDSRGKLVPLQSLKGYGDLEAVAISLVEEFDSLPWQFRVSCPLPRRLNSAFQQYCPEYTLSEEVRIITPNDEYLGQSFLQVDVQGFISDDGRTPPMDYALAILKAFFGLSLAVGFLQDLRVSSDIPSLFGSPLEKTHMLIYKQQAKSWVLSSVVEVPDDVRQTLDKFALDTKGVPNVPEWVSYCLAQLSTVFRNSITAEKLRTAGEWFFDGSTGTNELLSYVQLAVVMEILLGDKSTSDIIGIGELLRNRCAYLIGKTQDDRNQVLDEFNRIYAVRSKIVHQGKSRLRPDERILFSRLKQLCKRVIAAEIDLLRKPP